MAAGLLARLHYDGPITEVQYWTSTFCLYAIGYPLASTLSYGLLSKVANGKTCKNPSAPLCDLLAAFGRALADPGTV